MPRPDLNRVHPFYHNYISLVTEEELLKSFELNEVLFFNFLKGIPEAKHDYRYAEGKWTIKEMLQHLMDAERVFAYRALCFARKDSQVLPGFDENEYARQSLAHSRKWEEMTDEFFNLRKATHAMFASFSKEQLNASGISGGGMNNYVLGIGFVMLGHCNHHKRILEERYL